MELMLKKQNEYLEKKISEKVDNVRNEMNVAIKAETERQEKMETEQVDMKKQMNSLVTQVEDMRKTMQGAVANN